jgi:hypothetical protein
MTLVLCSLFGDAAFGEPGVVLVVDKILMLGLEYQSGSSVIIVYFYFLAVCIRTVIRVLRCCRGWV